MSSCYCTPTHLTSPKEQFTERLLHSQCKRPKCSCSSIRAMWRWSLAHIHQCLQTKMFSPFPTRRIAKVNRVKMWMQQTIRVYPIPGKIVAKIQAGLYINMCEPNNISLRGNFDEICFHLASWVSSKAIWTYHAFIIHICYSLYMQCKGQFIAGVQGGGAYKLWWNEASQQGISIGCQRVLESAWSNARSGMHDTMWTCASLSVLETPSHSGCVVICT